MKFERKGKRSLLFLVIGDQEGKIRTKGKHQLKLKYDSHKEKCDWNLQLEEREVNGRLASVI